MLLKDFDITLKPLEKKDIEMVRKWRNSEKIKRYALNQNHISKDQQETWFASLAQKEDEYFVIEQHETPLGLIWFNKRDERVETGFYIYDETKQNSLMPYKIVTLFHDYLFNTKGFKTLTCKIQHNNPRAVRFNLSLGYRENTSHNEYKRYTLSDEDYKKANTKILKLLLREKK